MKIYFPLKSILQVLLIGAVFSISLAAQGQKSADDLARELSNPTFSPGKPSLLFEGHHGRTGQARADYDITPDGQRFLIMKDEATGSEINVVLNWFEELKRLVPTP